ncbi:MAG: transglutaminase family protein [Desulfobacterales bacterium]|nr:transglutaminase family protein [Desulfobacterales bacterium]
MKLSSSEKAHYLSPTPHIDCDSEVMQNYVHTVTQGLATPIEKAIALFTSVRDDVLYDPYYYDLSPEGMRGSSILMKGRGYCVAKALVFTTASRAAGIPARLGFADVKNHLSTKRLRDLMGTDLFVYHGYSEIHLGKKWLKVTPTFNASLCRKFGVIPLEFDGENHCLFHPYDTQGRKHMEYVKDRGPYEEIPVDEIINASLATYPKLFEALKSLDEKHEITSGDFYLEAELEKASA